MACAVVILVDWDSDWVEAGGVLLWIGEFRAPPQFTYENFKFLQPYSLNLFFSPVSAWTTPFLQICQEETYLWLRWKILGPFIIHVVAFLDSIRPHWTQIWCWNTFMWPVYDQYFQLRTSIWSTSGIQCFSDCFSGILEFLSFQKSMTKAGAASTVLLCFFCWYEQSEPLWRSFSTSMKTEEDGLFCHHCRSDLTPVNFSDYHQIIFEAQSPSVALYPK